MNDLRLAIMRYVARHAAEDLDSRDGWCRWGYDPDNDPWTWDDYRPLVADGLLERREAWKDVLLRLTPEGWAVLGGQPLTEPETTGGASDA